MNRPDLGDLDPEVGCDEVGEGAYISGERRLGGDPCGLGDREDQIILFEDLQLLGRRLLGPPRRLEDDLDSLPRVQAPGGDLTTGAVQVDAASLQGPASLSPGDPSVGCEEAIEPLPLILGADYLANAADGGPSVFRSQPGEDPILRLGGLRSVPRKMRAIPTMKLHLHAVELLESSARRLALEDEILGFGGDHLRLGCDPAPTLLIPTTHVSPREERMCANVAEIRSGSTFPPM